jgi:hypothetical protein
LDSKINIYFHFVPDEGQSSAIPDSALKNISLRICLSDRAPKAGQFDQNETILLKNHYYFFLTII